MNKKDGDEWWWIGEKSVDERSLRPQIGHSFGSSLKKDDERVRVGHGRDRHEQKE